MKVLFISTSCSKKKYNEIFKKRNKELIDPQQKFCNLLIDGMSRCDGMELECLTALPVSASTIDQKIFNEEVEEVVAKLKYRYLAFRNGKILRYLTLYINSLKAVRGWVNKNKDYDMVMICDALSYFITRPAQKIAAKKGIKIVGIVTDLPFLSTNMKDREESVIKKIGIYLFQYLTNKSLNNYDAYIPLTRSINGYINPIGKPMVIIEGSVDSREVYDNIENKKKKVMLYAGGIYEKYGLRNLVEAFIKADTNDYELHIYGEGSYVDKLKNLAKKHSNVKYMGMVTLDEIVQKEKEAMILVNPRPSDEEFSKYSFPSKTLEYMVSGTALLTTRLYGIPDEYFEYVYSFGAEDVESMSNKISELCNLKDNELIAMGMKAYKFVSKKKNNVNQAHKIGELLEELLVQ